MNFNYASQHQGVVAWTGAAGPPIDIRRHVGFSFTFNVIADIGADTTFKFHSAPASDADPCLPGVFVPVPEVLTCVADWGVQPLPEASILIPAGTKAGSVCTGTLPCKPDAFIQVVAGVGEVADVQIIAVLSGPK
jgi:hypothetical protein